jgi:hypothetical protein
MPWLNANQTEKLCSKWLDYVNNLSYRDAVFLGKKYNLASENIYQVESLKNLAILYRDILNQPNVPVKAYSLSSLIALEHIFSQEELVALRSNLEQPLLPSELSDFEERDSLRTNRREENGPYSDSQMMAKTSIRSRGLEL